MELFKGIDKLIIALFVCLIGSGSGHFYLLILLHLKSITLYNYTVFTIHFTFNLISFCMLLVMLNLRYVILHYSCEFHL